MKNIVVLLCFFIFPIFGFSQLTDRSVLEFNVACSCDTFEKKDGCKIIFSLKNELGDNIIIPKVIRMASKTSKIKNAISYEVFHITGKDTVDYTFLARSFVSNYSITQKDSIQIKNGEIYYFTASPDLPEEYFTEAGTYKIRFIFPKEMLEGILTKNLVSDWVVIRVRREY